MFLPSRYYRSIVRGRSSHDHVAFLPRILHAQHRASAGQRVQYSTESLVPETDRRLARDQCRHRGQDVVARHPARLSLSDRLHGGAVCIIHHIRAGRASEVEGFRSDDTLADGRRQLLFIAGAQLRDTQVRGPYAYRLAIRGENA